jgi:UrcA family protein
MNTIHDTSSTSRFGLVTRTGLVTLATACGVLLLAGTAWSAEPYIVTGHALSDDPSIVTTVVSFTDLNLNSEAGAKTLHGRLRGAANKVCSGLEGGALRLAYKWRTCVDDALARAVEQIDQPMLTSYHVTWMGKHETAAMVAKE